MTGLLYFDKNPVLYYFRYITNGGAFLIGLIVFYLAAGFFVVYFTTGFINVSYTMKWQSFWAGAGRTINNIGAGIVGVISYVIVKTPGDHGDERHSYTVIGFHKYSSVCA